MPSGRRSIRFALCAFSLLFAHVVMAAGSDPVAHLPAWQLRDEVVALRARLAHVPPKRDAATWRHWQSDAFSVRWQPRIEQSAVAGDPFAQWLLHDCNSLPELTRDLGDEAPCRQIPPVDLLPPSPDLAATGFAGAVALSESSLGGMAIQSRCRGRSQDCLLKEAEHQLQMQLDVVENEGVLQSVSQYTVRSVCPLPKKGEPFSLEQRHCWHQARLLTTLDALAPRAFVLSLTPGDPEFADASTNSQGYGDLGPVPDAENNPMAGPDAPSRELLEGGLVNPRLSPQQREQLDRYLHAEDLFYTEVWNALERMRNSIDAQLARDPRWRLLLREHRTYDAAQWHESRSVAHWRKKASVSPMPVRDSIFMGRYVGQYYEADYAVHAEHKALTVLRHSGNSLTGHYLMVSGDGAQTHVEVGRIDNCLPPSDNELICTYDDRYGFGSVTFLFNADASEFGGVWKNNYPGQGFARFDAGNWDELKRWWTGKRL